MGGVFFEGWLSLDSLLGSTVSFFTQYRVDFLPEK